LLLRHANLSRFWLNVYLSVTWSGGKEKEQKSKEKFFPSLIQLNMANLGLASSFCCSSCL